MRRARKGKLTLAALSLSIAALGTVALAAPAEAAEGTLHIQVSSTNTTLRSVSISGVVPGYANCVAMKADSLVHTRYSGDFITVIGYSSNNCAGGTGLAGQNVRFEANGGAWRVVILATGAQARPAPR